RALTGSRSAFLKASDMRSVSILRSLMESKDWSLLCQAEMAARKKNKVLWQRARSASSLQSFVYSLIAFSKVVGRAFQLSVRGRAALAATLLRSSRWISEKNCRQLGSAGVLAGATTDWLRLKRGCLA